MTKKAKRNNDVVGVMVQIQEQLAQMNQKLDSFMTKSLTELADARAAAKPVVIRQAPAQTFTRQPQRDYPPHRQMYAVVCFECGKDTELPFKPNGNRPVYCRKCFAKRKEQSRISRTTPINLAGPSTTSPIISKTPVPKSKMIKKAAKKKRAPKKKAAAKKASAKKKSAPKKKVAKKKRAIKKKSKKK